jgi:SAM-dependent methyltransferase
MPPVDPARADQAFRQQSGDAWVRLQRQLDAQLDPFGRAALARLELAAGARVLDVGCGTGQTLLQLAEIVGPTGSVLGVDISEQMVAGALARTAGNPAVEVRCVDAQTHVFAPGAFDAIYSRFGVMFFEDAGAAFTNLRRALRPGGRLAFVCWQALARNPWAEVPLQAVLRVLPPGSLPALLRPGCPGPFYLSDRDRIGTLLSGAGFADVAIEAFEQPFHLGAAVTLEEAVAYCRQIGPAARAMDGAPAELGPALQTALTGALAPFAGDRGVWMDAAAFVVTAGAAA